MSRTRLGAAFLAATALLASGCGGSSKSSSPTAATSTVQVTTEPGTAVRTPTAPANQGSKALLTRAELIAKADLLCARANAKRAAIQIRGPQDYAHLLPALAATEQTVAAELSKLMAPSSMTHDWQQIVAGAKRLAAGTAKLGEYAERHNGIKGANQMIAPTTLAEQTMLATARRNGFNDCGRIS